MKYNLSTENITASPRDIAMLEQKLERMKKYLEAPFFWDLVILHDSHHRTGDVVTVRINIEQRGKVLHTERTGVSIQEALDLSLDAIRQELVKEKDRLIKRRRSVE